MKNATESNWKSVQIESKGDEMKSKRVSKTSLGFTKFRNLAQRREWLTLWLAGCGLIGDFAGSAYAQQNATQLEVPGNAGIVSANAKSGATFTTFDPAGSIGTNASGINDAGAIA